MTSQGLSSGITHEAFVTLMVDYLLVTFNARGIPLESHFAMMALAQKGISVFHRGMPFLDHFVFDHGVGFADHWQGDEEV